MNIKIRLGNRHTILDIFNWKLWGMIVNHILYLFVTRLGIIIYNQQYRYSIKDV